MSKYPFKDISAELGYPFEYKGFKGRAHMTHKEWECIHSYTKDKNYLEIGSYQGFSTTAADHAAYCFSIDLIIRPLVKTLSTWFEGDSTAVSTAQQVANNFFDFVLIDGNHTYEFCSADLRNYWPKVKPGGIMGIHDYGINGTYLGPWGVTRAVNEFFQESQYIKTVDSLILFQKEKDENEL